MSTATTKDEQVLAVTPQQGFGGLLHNTHQQIKRLGSTPIPGTDLSFKVLTSKEELETAFSLRYEVFCVEKGIADPGKYPNKMETDEYDDKSLHVAVLDEYEEIIAYARLVLPCDVFPIERTNTLPSCFKRNTAVESSRGLVVKDKRHSDVIWHLSNSIYAFCRDNGFEHILSFSNSIMYNGYKKRDFPFEYVGEPVVFHGHKSFPLVIKVVHNNLDFTRKQQSLNTVH